MPVNERSPGERRLTLLLRAANLYAGCRHQYQFHETRRWRFDFAWPREKVAIEVHGAVWTSGRHTRGYGFREDCVKATEAAALGWLLLPLTTDMVMSGMCMPFIEKTLALRGYSPDVGEVPFQKQRGKKGPPVELPELNDPPDSAWAE